jgi:hypothetical protein
LVAHRYQVRGAVSAPHRANSGLDAQKSRQRNQSLLTPSAGNFKVNGGVFLKISHRFKSFVSTRYKRQSL